MLRRGYRLVCTPLSLVDFLERGVHAGIACLFTIGAGAPRSEVKVLSQCLSYRCRERAILSFFLVLSSFFFFFFPRRDCLVTGAQSRHYRWLTRKKETPRRERMDAEIASLILNDLRSSHRRDKFSRFSRGLNSNARAHTHTHARAHATRYHNNPKLITPDLASFAV